MLALERTSVGLLMCLSRREGVRVYIGSICPHPTYTVMERKMACQPDLRREGKELGKGRRTFCNERSDEW